ncbi:carbohydrate esterase family 5 protein [Karstenula rhodostoma CBS 690.94]|uniref:cutinase n=1 Tax=Karstenula rhodostoma CBS 690.94 TaxID=1392251 RepID=A0A9P4P8Q1_9PLEO|nr:carbohydrate esterase family 5 protein [Karstenula rhodostoma CBS 690.94]
MPSFSMPSFSMPSLPAGLSLPTGDLGSWGSGSGSTLPSFGSLPGGTGAIPSVPSTATPTIVAAQPTSTGSTGGSGTVGSNCTPQAASGGGLGGTENGVTDKNCCTGLTVIFARGTSEMGNVGTISGPPMFKSLRSKLGDGKVTIQGVTYPADAAGNANMGASGGPEMAKLVKAAKSQCPGSKIFVSGYSQGAMVVHNAFQQGISASDVTGAIMFGDPLKTMSISGLSTDKVKEFCATADSICGTGTNPTGSHLSYGNVADEAANWVIKAAGLS